MRRVGLAHIRYFILCFADSGLRIPCRIPHLETLQMAQGGPEMLNSIVHEIMHICQHVAIEDGIDPLGEDICYLGGDLAGMVSDIVCELTCPHCSGR